MRRRFLKQSYAFLFLILTSIQQVVPAVSLVHTVRANSPELTSPSATTISLNGKKDSLIITATQAKSFSYNVVYTYGEDQQAAVQGEAVQEGTSLSAEPYLGTCSSSICTPHTDLKSGKVELDITKNDDSKQQTSVEFNVINGTFWLNESGKQTVSSVELNHEYTAPQNNDVKVTFTKLPAQPGSLSIQEVTLTPEQVQMLGAVSNKAYDITSSMVDGSFAYTLKLPIPAEQSNNEELTIKYAENLDQLSTAATVQQTVETEGTSVEVVGLDHFTIFAVVPTAPASAQPFCIANVVTPATQCFTTIQAAINAAAANDTILIANGTYSGNFNIPATKDGLTIQGESQAGVIFNSTNVFGIDIPEGTNNITLRNLTVNYNRTASAGYAIKAYNSTGLTIENVTLNGVTSTNSRGIDLNATTNVTLNNVTITDFDRNGIGITSRQEADDLLSSNITFNNITLNNNAASGGWGGISFYTNGNGGGSGNISDVSFTGSNSISNGANGIVIEATAPFIVQGTSGDLDLGTLAFSNHSTAHIRNFSNSNITALDATFDGANGVSAAQTTLDAIEAGILHDCNSATFLKGVCNAIESTTFGSYTGIVTYNITDTTPPAQPLFWVEEDTSSVEIQWQVVNDAVSYAIYRDGSALASGETGTSYIDLTAGTLSTHTYEVRAVDAANLESAAQTAKQTQTLDIVIDDTTVAADLNTSGEFTMSAGWSGYDINASPVLQNAVGGGNFSTVGPSNGQVARWTTTNQIDGVYEVYVQYICDSSRGTAQYTVTSGVFDQGTVNIDQSTTDGSTACGGQSSVSVAGPQWVSLGQFTFINAQGIVTLTAPAGEVNLLADAVAFRYVEPYSSIRGYKYNDVNGNGIFDLAEQSEVGNPNALDGWDISIYSDLNAAPLATMITGNDLTVAGDVNQGEYAFLGLDPGTYYICETLLPGWQQMEPSTGIANPNGDGSFCRTVEAISGSNATNENFGNFAYATISGTKWNDENHDGVFDNDESGLCGWMIFIDANGNQSYDIGEQLTMTGCGGTYSLINLSSGTYEVCEVQQSGWRQTYPANNACHTVTVTTSGQTISDINFGNTAEGAIVGIKFADYFGDGVSSIEEGIFDVLFGGINGWTINLFDQSWNNVGSQQTQAVPIAPGENVNGIYLFDQLLSGRYYICEESRVGWQQTASIDLLAEFLGSGTTVVADPNNPGSYCQVVELGAGSISVNLFGNFQLGHVTGVKFNDLNDNGLNDSEPLLANWTITATGTTTAQQPVNQSVQTNAQGQYELYLLPGTYTVCEQQQANWTQTAPQGNNGCHSIEVTYTGQVFNNLDFGNHFTPPTSGGSSSDNSGTSAPGPASPPVCSDSAPSSAPANLHISSSGTNTVTLRWNAVASATHYALSFTRTSDGAQFGAANIGNTTQYTIQGISGGSEYNFEVFAVNGCQPGPRATVKSRRILGPQLSSRPVGEEGQVLGTEIIFNEEVATEGAVIQVDPVSDVAGVSAVCQDPWWKWLLFVGQALVLTLASYIAKRTERKRKVLVPALTTVVIVVIIWLFFCSLFPWIYLALGITLIEMAVRQLGKSESKKA